MTTHVPTHRQPTPTVLTSLAPRFGLAGSISLALTAAKRRRRR